LLTKGIITAEREGSIRVSAHLYNNHQDIMHLITGLDEASRK
jgi:selenocysteine lyase/cysteine desulfurase